MTDEDWHSRTATALFEHDNKTQSMVRTLSLLPLTSGEWVSTSGRAVYYSHVNGVPVPRDLHLDLVDPRASENAERRRLFNYLGVHKLLPHHVRDRIMRKYMGIWRPTNIDIAISRNHLTFLYLTAHLDDRPDFRTQNLWIFNHRDHFQNPAEHHFYIAGQ
jgi:hypothetical protein